MDLKGYEETKFAFAEPLRAADALDARGLQGRHLHADLVRDLFSRLAEDRFNLVVVGRFSRGKTSLMNAVLASDRLPTGIRPLTSVITTVTYGSVEKAVIHYRGRGLPEEVPISDLPQYITENGNSANRLGIAIAEVQLPAELLRRGFHFIDTPGLGSPIVENTRTTERFLPEAEAFVLVTSYEGTLSEEELRFLGDAARSGRRVFIVVNKADTVSPAEREEALGYLRERLSAIGLAEDAIFSLSARDGLAAKLAPDDRLLQESGIAAFEAGLVRFLVDDKSHEFLLPMAERIAVYFRLLPPEPEIAQLGKRLAEIAKDVDGGGRAGVSRSAPASSPLLPANLGPMRPCPICAEAAEQIYDFLRRYQYDVFVDPGTQRELAERNGLCSFHVWGYEAMASPVGTCVGFAPLLDRLAEGLAAAAAVSCPSPAVALPACVLCDARAAAESAAVQRLALRLRQHPDPALGTLGDLCLPHFRLLAAVLDDRDLAGRVFARQAALLRRVAEDMRRYALKHEGIRRHLVSAEETQAAARALLLLGGHRSLNTPRPNAPRPAS
jgi:Dynamin family